MTDSLTLSLCQSSNTILASVFCVIIISWEPAAVAKDDAVSHIGSQKSFTFAHTVSSSYIVNETGRRKDGAALHIFYPLSFFLLFHWCNSDDDCSLTSAAFFELCAYTYRLNRCSSTESWNLDIFCVAALFASQGRTERDVDTRNDSTGPVFCIFQVHSSLPSQNTESCKNWQKNRQ